MLESRNSRTFSKVTLKIKYLGENEPTRTFAKSEPPFTLASVDVDVVTDIDIDIQGQNLLLRSRMLMLMLSLILILIFKVRTSFYVREC